MHLGPIFLNMLTIYKIQEKFNSYMKVLTEEESICYGGGNATSIEVYRDFTLLEDLFLQEEDEEVICKVETIEFVNLL